MSFEILGIMTDYKCLCLKCNKIAWQGVGYVRFRAYKHIGILATNDPVPCPHCGNRDAPQPRRFATIEEIQAAVDMLQKKVEANDPSGMVMIADPESGTLDPTERVLRPTSKPTTH